VKDVQPQSAYVVEEMKSELTRLLGRIEDLERAQKQSQEHQSSAVKEEIKKLEDRIVELERAQESMIAELKKSKDQAPTNTENVEFFEAGKKSYQAKNYNDAIEQFSQYLRATKGKHLEEATFLRGEAYYDSKQYKKAIIDYSKFPEKFTKSKKMPNVLFKIGQSFEALSMKDDAKGFYQEIVEKFPKAPEAAKAKKKLK
jgi:tol-pal system protein YbgF